MTVICRTCQRVNPAAAHYCYFDGAALANGGTGLGPVAVGSQPFLSPFVFPSGRPCRNFDELVLASQELWTEAQELLREGYFAVFLGGIGRADLARLAKQSKESPDPDRALDDFLGRLPSDVRQPASLHVQPREVNLGRVGRSENRRFVLQLENQGNCLLHGSVASDDTPWLVLGDPPGVPRKIFQGLHDATIPVQVLGERMRAGTKPVEGRLIIESNGGTQTIVVRAEVPVRPFTEGVLAGATTPRQVAEKAKAHPKQAIPLFESGAVAEWYKVNGWVYPIQGPQASGLGAVQQFFEALGLTTPPHVEVSELFVKLQGAAGSRLEHDLKVTAVENRPVFAHATSGVPWLRVAKVIPEGRTAHIRLEVPAVPDSPGETLLGKVQVSANGNQRFTVAVALAVSAGVRKPGRTAPVVVDAADPRAVPPPPRVPPPAAVPEPVLLTPPPLLEPTLLPAPVPVPEPPRPVHPIPIPAAVPAMGVLEAPRPAPVQPWSPQMVGDAPALVPEPVAAVRPAPLPTPENRQVANLPPRGRSWPHLVPLGVIVLGLLGVVFHDFRLDAIARSADDQEQAGAEEVIDNNAYVTIHAHDHAIQKGEDVTPDAGIFDRPTRRFGLRMEHEKDPEDKTGKKRKRLTFDPWGRSNNTCLHINGEQVLFGDPRGAWVKETRPLAQGKEIKTPLGGFESVWTFRNIEVTQHVEVVRGRQSRLLDTCLVYYTLADKRKNGPPRRVGIRFLLDTFIGANDGVPFTIPQKEGLCNTMQGFDNPRAVPDFIEAWEKDDPKDPGTVARIQFRLGKRLEPPTRVFLGGWPNGNLARFGYRTALGERTLWDVPRVSMRELHERARQFDPANAYKVKPDSAVTVYWDDRPLAAGGRREVGFTYGLGQVVKGDKLALSVSGQFVPDGEFTLTARVSNPKPTEKLTLTLPAGFELLPGFAREQKVAATVTWRIRAGAVGRYKLRVESSGGIEQIQPISIYPAKKGGAPGVFD